jgi:hypothetical protein
VLPFTPEQFLQVFAHYNEAMWPLQWIAWLLGVAACIAVARPGPVRDRAVPAALALFWLWTGIAYHAVFFAAINRAAWLFGALFVLQGLLFAACAWQGTLRFGRRGPAAWLGCGLALFALVAYPLLGLYAGHGYPRVPLFGITPCPLVLFTFGMLLLLAQRVPGLAAAGARGLVAGGRQRGHPARRSAGLAAAVQRCRRRAPPAPRQTRTIVAPSFGVAGMNGARSLVETLLKSGVDTCFANPGTSEMHFVAALDQSAGIRCVLGLQENVVTGMADGYWRIAGKPACTLLHCGPGLANGLANLHNARRARSGIVNIVGDQATYHRPYDAPLTADTDALARTVSGWLRTSGRSEHVGRDAAAAVQAARTLPGRSPR